MLPALCLPFVPASHAQFFSFSVFISWLHPSHFFDRWRQDEGGISVIISSRISVTHFEAVLASLRFYYRLCQHFFVHYRFDFGLRTTTPSLVSHRRYTHPGPVLTPSSTSTQRSTSQSSNGMAGLDKTRVSAFILIDSNLTRPLTLQLNVRRMTCKKSWLSSNIVSSNSRLALLVSMKKSLSLKCRMAMVTAARTRLQARWRVQCVLIYDCM